MTKDYAQQVFEELVAAGIIERVRDAHGNQMFRNGSPLWKATPKAKNLTAEEIDAARRQAARRFPRRP
jgi:hypothetical protein